VLILCQQRVAKVEGIMDSHSVSCWIIIVNGLNGGYSNIGSIVGVLDTTNLKIHISAPGNASEGGK
jgi:hypothetical protein